MARKRKESDQPQQPIAAPPLRLEWRSPAELSANPLFQPSPCATRSNVSRRSPTDSKLACEQLVPDALRVAKTDGPDRFLRQLARWIVCSATLAGYFRSMEQVLRASHVLQVFGDVVCLASVLVIHLKTGRARANERLGYQPMHKPPDCFIANPQADRDVAAVNRAASYDATGLHAAAFADAANSAYRTRLVTGMKGQNRTPSFVC